MKRMLLISILTLGFVWSWSLVCAENGFYVIPVKNRNYAPIEMTGATKCYNDNGEEIACSGTGQDGEYQKGVAWPNPRFIDNGDGTVTDKFTDLIWLKDASCVSFFSGDSTGQNYRVWGNALMAANSLAMGYCELTDGSISGNWRLPNIRELHSLIDFSNDVPALPTGHPFTGVQSAWYWSSTTYAYSPVSAWRVLMLGGGMSFFGKDGQGYVWPVRAGN